ncbi:MAG: helix-turn-helix domain-containing protein [Petrimonas sp.]|jgi:AraC-like DNA-binding protein
MQPDLYISVTFASAIVLSILGFMLLGIRIKVEERTVNLRLSRGLLSLAYFMLALPAFIEFFFEGERNVMFVEIFTPAGATVQSMFFTFALLTFLRPIYVTRRQMLWHVTIIFGAIFLYLIAALSVNHYHYVIYIGVAAYLCLLFIYARLFRKKYAMSLRQLEEYYDEDEQGRLRWVKNGFYAALSLGIIATVSAYFPHSMYICFTIAYIVFYAWFVVRFFNYAAKVDFYLSATTCEPEQLPSERFAENDPVKEARLRDALEQWVLDGGYTQGEISTEEVAELLGTDLRFLRDYFRDNMSSDFRTWRIELRIRKAQELIADYPEISLNQIAQQVGFATRSNFYLYFRKITGQSPADYRDQVADKK